jgi:hypothetical protein
MMEKSLRKFSLITHVTLATGWIGAAAAYLVLVVAAMISDDLLTLRAAWIAMELIGWYLIVPLALASLISGLVMSLGTPWGLFRHYWVIASFGLTIVATAVLLGHMPTVSTVARAAVEPEMANVAALHAGLRGELLHAGVGILILFVIEGLNFYKPSGMTAYGRRKAPLGAIATAVPDPDARPAWGWASQMPGWVRVLALHAIGLALLLMILHITGGGLTHH